MNSGDYPAMRKEGGTSSDILSPHNQGTHPVNWIENWQQISNFFSFVISSHTVVRIDVLQHSLHTSQSPNTQENKSVTPSWNLSLSLSLSLSLGVHTWVTVGRGVIGTGAIEAAAAIKWLRKRRRTTLITYITIWRNLSVAIREKGRKETEVGERKERWKEKKRCTISWWANRFDWTRASITHFTKSSCRINVSADKKRSKEKEVWNEDEQSEYLGSSEQQNEQEEQRELG